MPSPPPLNLTITATAEHTLLTVAGELDTATVGRFSARVDEELHLGPVALIIDLTGTSFCAASALRALLRAVARGRATGVHIAIVADHSAVVRPVRALGLSLPLHRRLPDALDWLNIVSHLSTVVR
ncbi:STAS domain-containing protein [Amycolatopsis sp. NBC_01488]|uniref:STAS domain-containing protein n=1 Tax=Amycolatopsis sp. NBC_01488 TaxID=2903563 RepID=UPI002E28DA77|nr:STAS domain-containing protein [Amycolatopsis sp. NBC_01488]